MKKNKDKMANIENLLNRNVKSNSNSNCFYAIKTQKDDSLTHKRPSLLTRHSSDLNNSKIKQGNYNINRNIYLRSKENQIITTNCEKGVFNYKQQNALISGQTNSQSRWCPTTFSKPNMKIYNLKRNKSSYSIQQQPKKTTSNLKDFKYSRHFTHNDSSSDSSDDGCDIDLNRKRESLPECTEPVNVRPLISECVVNVDTEDIQRVHSSASWREFDKHIFSIDNDDLHYRPKPIRRSGSPIHHKLVEDERRRRKARIVGFQKAIKITKNMNNLKKIVQNENEKEDTVPSESDAEDDHGKVKRESRGWMVLRRYIQEKRIERKRAQNTSGWSLVSRTINHMTDMEKARHELYQRYLEYPHLWRDGLALKSQYMHLFSTLEWNDTTPKLNPRVPIHRRKTGVEQVGSNQAVKSAEILLKMNEEKRPNTTSRLSGNHGNRQRLYTTRLSAASYNH